jgi:phosphate transport system substrate-binding protein
MKTQAWLRICHVPLTLAVGMALAAAGCSPSANAPGKMTSTTTGASANEQANAAASALEGPVEVDGSSTVYLMSEAAAAAFRKEYPNVKVSVGKSGTGGGFKRFVTGETDVSDASRPIKKDELALATKNGVEFLELPVAYDGLTIAVNKQNDWVDEITIDQLKKIFLAEDPAKTWKDVDPSWPDLEIKIYSPGADSGTYDYFKEVVAGKEGSLRDDMSLNEDDNNLVRGVDGDKGAIGYFGAAYYFSDQERLRALKIVNPETDKAVGVAADTIKSGEYAPFSRPLFIYVNVERMNQPQVEAFVAYYLEHAGDFAKEVQYVELPDPVYDAAKNHFDEIRTGSHYYDESGADVHGTLEELFVDDAKRRS